MGVRAGVANLPVSAVEVPLGVVDGGGLIGVDTAAGGA